MGRNSTIRRCGFSVGVFSWLLLIHLSASPVWANQAELVNVADEFFASPQPLEVEGFREVFGKLSPRLYIAGQPTPEGLERAAELGVVKVINLRTNFEMDDRTVVDFDEAQTIEQLGMDYVHIPLGGPDTPYAPEAVDRFASALEIARGDDNGAVLLHCTVAWRATHMWTAYLIRHRGLAFEDAVAVARQLNFGNLPLEGFLGQSLTVVPLEQSAEAPESAKP